MGFGVWGAGILFGDLLGVFLGALLQGLGVVWVGGVGRDSAPQAMPLSVLSPRMASCLSYGTL